MGGTGRGVGDGDWAAANTPLARIRAQTGMRRIEVLWFLFDSGLAGCEDYSVASYAGDGWERGRHGGAGEFQGVGRCHQRVIFSGLVGGCGVR